MAKKICVESLFSFNEAVEVESFYFLNRGFDLPVHEDHMVHPFTKMRRKPWSDTGFLD